jgi:gluconolactonase
MTYFKATMIIAVLLFGFVAVADETPSTVAADAKLQEVYSAESFFEGPTWDPVANKLLFTSFPLPFDPAKPTQVLRLEEPGKASVWLDKAEGVNGTILSYEGRLLGAQAFGHRVMSYRLGGKQADDAKVLYFNDKLHQPNDVCQAPNGNIYFSDPDFENAQTGAVYLLKADGKASKIIDLPIPNGVIASLDGKTLYVGDDHLHMWFSYPIKPDGNVGEKQVFFKPDASLPGKANGDGMTIDEHGNLYFSGECCFPEKGGVWVIDPNGKSLGRIATPEFCSNVCFGGEDGKTLFLTCRRKVYQLPMNVRGGDFGRAR